MASICSSKFQLVPASRELSARHVNESAVMSVKRHRSWGSSSSLRSTMSEPSARRMKRRTRPLTGSIQVERQASIAES
jgi:hypothetical protein